MNLDNLDDLIIPPKVLRQYKDVFEKVNPEVKLYAVRASLIKALVKTLEVLGKTLADFGQSDSEITLVDPRKGYRFKIFLGYYLRIVTEVGSIYSDADWKRMDQLKKELPFERISFTDHSLDQFKIRFPEKIGDSNKVLKIALAVLAEASELDAISEVGKVLRIINNNFDSGIRFFRQGHCRFAIREGIREAVVLTVEYTYKR